MMQVERFDVSPIEQELAFNIWREKRGVGMVLVDGDDTLWQAAPVFDQQKGVCLDLLTSTGILTRDEWRSEMRRIDNELFESAGVNPNRWNLMVEQLGQYGLNEAVLADLRQTLAGIYQIPLNFIKGTEEGLKFLKKVRMPIGVVTHANRNWTWRKYNDWLDLKRFLGWDEVYIVGENGHKTKASWQAAMDYFGVRPGECLVGGDSPGADMNPVAELGVRHCFLVPNQLTWSIHQQPMNEEITRRIASVNDLRWLGKEVVYRKRS